MKIGIFDSGLGGLIVTKAIHKAMPEYDYVYLGDTKRVPYGNRSHETVFEFTKQGVDYLFRKENCAIVIIACNTASARALREIQEEYMPAYNAMRSIAGRPKNYPDRKVLGVLIPSAEEAAKFKRVGIIATTGTVSSLAFSTEIKKLNKNTKIFQNSAPMLVPLAEEGEIKSAIPFIEKYLQPFLNKKIDALVLGCTHYPIFKNQIRKILGKKVKVLSQDEIIPKKLKNYLARHKEIQKELSQKHTARILVTDVTQNMTKLTKKWFGTKTKPRFTKL
jgi:glutamate racemase